MEEPSISLSGKRIRYSLHRKHCEKKDEITHYEFKIIVYKLSQFGSLIFFVWERVKVV